MFEGVPNYPDAGRFWQVIDKHKVNIFYTAPTAIRALMREGEAPVKKTTRTSLRLLGSVGEPINPEAWMWYYRVIGDERCPIVDTWWQTETGGILITPLPGATTLKPGSATRPFFGVEPVMVDAEGKELQGAGDRGNLCLIEALARADAHGLGRSRALHRHLLHDLSRHVLHRRRLPPRRGRLLLDHRPRRRRDQRLRPSHRHRRGRERAGRHPKVAEAAVVGFPHDIKGQGIYAYVTLKAGAAVRPRSCSKELVARCARRSARSPRPT